MLTISRPTVGGFWSGDRGRGIWFRGNGIFSLRKCKSGRPTEGGRDWERTVNPSPDASRPLTRLRNSARFWTVEVLSRFGRKRCEPNGRRKNQRAGPGVLWTLRVTVTLHCKAVGDNRSPRRFATSHAAGEFRQVLDCGSPLPLWTQDGRAEGALKNPAGWPRSSLDASGSGRAPLPNR